MTEQSPKLRVLLVQLPVPNNSELNVPLALGYLKAYAADQGLLDMAEIEIMPRGLADHAGDALLVDEIVARRPDVVGMSLYTWNSERSLDVLGRVRERLPELRTVVGGPEVQRDNLWVLRHPAVDVAVLGEGEQTFAELLRRWCSESVGATVEDIAGLIVRRGADLMVTSERTALADLGVVPSPYLLGYLDPPAGSMQLIEVSRWCPYACSFCLYGRNMGAKLGNRYFGLERVVAEIRWGRDHGVTRIHFVEANLNLVPLFWPLMEILAELNADHRMTFYAELRGEHLTDAVVAALDRANVRFVEVGLQTANPTALRASHRRTDLGKWAAGTRRLYARDIEVYLDVILGLPEDDAAGVAGTLQFLQDEQLGSYDVFMLQVLPGTAVRQQAAQYALRHQARPPYYVTGTSRFDYGELRRLRRELKLGADLDPDALDGLPEPRRTAFWSPDSVNHGIISRLRIDRVADVALLEAAAARLAAHVDLLIDGEALTAATPALIHAISRSPATVFDLYLSCDQPPAPDQLAEWRAALPYQPGYLDRVALYAAADPAAEHQRVSPRLFVVLPWTATVEPERYRDVAEIIWRYQLTADEPIPFGAWRGAGGAGILLSLSDEVDAAERATLVREIAAWEAETGRMVWMDAVELDEAVADEVTVYSGRI